jgi:LacI family transcriptional regulator
MASIYPRLLADRFSSVNIDDFHAAFDATNYLIKKGRSKIAFIAGSLADATSGEARFNGYKEGLRSNSIRFDKSLVRFGDFSIEAGEALALDIFSDTTNKPDAIFAAGDVIAIGALNAMKKLSIKVPEQVALVGFDDLTCATVCSPRLTTVRQPIRTIGSEAVKVLVSEITNHPSVPTRKILPYELIEREST